MTLSTIGQFEVRELLGSGGFGHVYAAVDSELGRWVAIKALRPEISGNTALVERFRAEGVSLARLNHPNITTLYALQRHGQDLFLVMELVNGRTLDAVLQRVRRLGVTETLAVIAQTAAGLGYAHRMGVIHRDIKPSNLMLTDTGVVKIMDFGIARIRGSRRLTQGGLLGTYAYLAPEQFTHAEGDERSDLYSLACVAYEMLSGNVPFDAQTEAAMMRGHLEQPPQPLRACLSDLDPRVDAAVLRALAKNPADRFETVEAFSDAIGAAAIVHQAVAIVHDQILSKIPAPPRPTMLAEPMPTGSTAGKQRRFAARMRHRIGMPSLPALVLGSVIVCIVAAAGMLIWQQLGENRTGAVVNNTDHGVPPTVIPPPGEPKRGVEPSPKPEPRPLQTAEGGKADVFPSLPDTHSMSLMAATQPSTTPLGKMNVAQPEAPQDPLRAAAERGDAGSMYALGLRYENGDGVARDPEKAADWFRRAAVLDHPAAMAQLAELYLAGDGVPTNEVEARYWYEKASKHDDPAGMFGLGYMYEGGRGGLAKDETAAVDLYRRAAEAGATGAMVILGQRYRTGRGVPKDYGQARNLYQLAADKGVPGAYIGLGILYEEGHGVPCDLEAARRWFQMAADKGNAQEKAQASRGLARLSGRNCGH